MSLPPARDLGATILEARGLELVYPAPRGPVAAVHEVDLTVAAGDFVAVLGPSGSGKSSLLFLLSGLRRPTKGRVRFLGHEWPRRVGDAARLRRRHLGFVFQEPFLVPYLTVRENAVIQMGRDRNGSLLERLAESLGLTTLLDEVPERLSAGERQRASILRALANEPALVLADEPTAWLDRENAVRVMKLLSGDLPRTSVVVVTHDPSLVADATRTLTLREGRLSEQRQT